MWLMAITQNSSNVEPSHHGRKFYETALVQRTNEEVEKALRRREAVISLKK